MGFRYFGESVHLQVDEDTLLFDMSNKNLVKIFFLHFYYFYRWNGFRSLIEVCLTYGFYFSNIKECLNGAFV